jgi:hypothetical protein
MNLSISRESLVLFIICLVDTLLTVVLVSAGVATEANPLMARCLDVGYTFFCAVKLIVVGITIAVAESYGRRHPEFARRIMRTAVVVYAGVYIMLFVAVNSV